MSEEELKFKKQSLLKAKEMLVEFADVATIALSLRNIEEALIEVNRQLGVDHE
jgi:hypothetical protein